jgi:gamma-glutamylcyclotransferase (GGCT)/AIG2-like uncharacterized protein YtfP
VTYYFAYGSNMDEEQMRVRCRGAALAGKGVLDDHRLGFTIRSRYRSAGAADIIPSPGDQVWGLVFHVGDEDLAALDRFEGRPSRYDRHVVRISTTRGDLEAWVYSVVAPGPFVAPSRSYLGIIRKAARRHGFPGAYVRMLEGVATVDGRSRPGTGTAGRLE